MKTETTDAKAGHRRFSRLAPATLLTTILLLVTSATASAAPNPATNIGTGPLPRACTNAPKGPVCVNGIVAALDKARARLGFGPYLLPKHFSALPGTEQLLTLRHFD